MLSGTLDTGSIVDIRRNFAENVGIKFYTPEEYFLDETPRSFTRTFVPGDYSSENTTGLYHQLCLADSFLTLF